MLSGHCQICCYINSKLFKFCIVCGAVTEAIFSCKGSMLTVTSTCMKHHASKWQSQPVLNHTSVGNVSICSSTLFTGNTFARIQNFAACFGLKFLSERVFYRHQDRYLFPVVNDPWVKEEAVAIQELLLFIHSQPKLQ